YERQFQMLITQLAKKGKVVILIDEYDKPIIDNLQNIEEAKRIRDVLKGFYTVIKAMDRYLRFVFLTGVSKFSKVGVFSGLNNLEDLTMRASFATALGITEHELRSNFDAHLDALATTLALTKAALLEKIRYWYNGFRFAEGGESVYNPFSLLLLFKEERFDNFWFATGTPTFLMNLIRERNYGLQEVTDPKLGHLAFSSYELERLEIAPLLVQTGYLTIKGYDPARRLYDLSYPNFEVEDAFLTFLLGSFTDVEKGLAEGYIWQLISDLQAARLADFFETFRIFFAQVPYTIRLKQEKYYQSIFHIIFTLIGLRAEAEVATDRGRIDAVIELAQRIYLFEFKLDGSAETALAQIKTHQYATKYRGRVKPVHLVGVNFAAETGEVREWLEEVDGQRSTDGGN
ncbi:MAG: AAA family ATPase, partial [Caldilineaceae bacterium]|nr:AAA family ATPase [Caldilineaceae bacterium]